MPEKNKKTKILKRSLIAAVHLTAFIRKFTILQHSPCVHLMLLHRRWDQAEIFEDAGHQPDLGTPNPALLNKIGMMSYPFLHSPKEMGQNCGHVMGLVVSAERAPRLNMSRLG